MTVQSPWFQRLAKKVVSEGEAMSPGELGACNKTLLIEMSWELIRRARSPHVVGESLEWLEFLSFSLTRRQGNGQLLQDLWVLWETRNQPQPFEGYFVEFGACDGRNISNTYLLEKEYGWSGIVAEPNPRFSGALRKNRSCSISTDCVYSSTGLTVPFKVVAKGEYSGLVKHLADDKHAAKREDDILVTDVTTISLADLLDVHGAPDRIDYLSIDTEGSEFEILSAYPFSERPIGLITVEHNGTSAREQIYELLTANGYRRKFAGFSRWDDWYVLESPHPSVKRTQTRKSVPKPARGRRRKR